jgi:poly-beta-hydroxybutyrate-responsive repressor
MSNKRLSLIKKTDKCSCKGYNLDKLLQPNILSLLATREMYGYLVIQELEKLDLFKGEKIDNTGIYRTLKHLEKKGLVKSQWDVEDGGPAKKIYQINDTGKECLENWIQSLEAYKIIVEAVIDNARRALNHV